MRFFYLTLGLALLLNVSYSKIVNVKDVGAIGDGVNNDDSAFQTALKMLSECDTLLIPEGRYLIDYLNIVELPKLTITGEGVLIASESTRQYFIVIRDSPFICIEGITIDGENNRSLGLDIHDSPNGEINNVKVTNIRGEKNDWSAAIRLRKNNSQFTISNSEITNISSNRNASVGVFLMSYEEEEFSENVVIKNLKIINIDSPNDADGIKIQQIGKSSNVQIVNCDFINNRKRAIKVQTDKVIIINNRIERTEKFANGFAVFSVYGNDIEIVDNSFVSYGNSSVNMFVDISAMKNIVIKNNKHTNSLESTANVRDFVLTKYHLNENSFSTENVVIENNSVYNVRNFLRVRSNLVAFEVVDNNVVNLESNFIFVVNDDHILGIEALNRNNSLSYRKHRYNEIYFPKRIEKGNIMLKKQE